MSDSWAVAFTALTGFCATVIATVITPLLTSHLAAKREDHLRTCDARYLAVRVAVILEQFASDCVSCITDHELFRDSKGCVGRQHGVLPQLPVYPEEADWKKLHPDLLARALSLRNEHSYSHMEMTFVEDNYEPHDVPEACSEQCGRCGYMARQLAADMRSQYGLPTFDPPWDADEILKPLHDRFLKRNREHTQTEHAT